jgi:hypothetical protein
MLPRAAHTNTHTHTHIRIKCQYTILYGSSVAPVAKGLAAAILLKNEDVKTWNSFRLSVLSYITNTACYEYSLQHYAAQYTDSLQPCEFLRGLEYSERRLCRQITPHYIIFFAVRTCYLQ